MRLWAIAVLGGVGLLILGMLAMVWTIIVGNPIWTELGVTGWEAALVMLGPLFLALLLVYAGYQIITTHRKEE